MNEKPQSLKDYIVRAYKKCTGSKKQEKEMTRKLKTLIAEVKSNNKMYVIDWNTYPLPLLA